MKKEDMAIIMTYSTIIKPKYSYAEFIKMKKDDLERIYKDFLKEERKVIIKNLKSEEE